jgi:phosphatidylglycerophosphatase A
MKENGDSAPKSFSRSFVLWIAQGLGIGRVPKAPGTFGSILGLGWFALLLWIGGFQPWLAALILLASIFASVWTCEAAERILGEKDPGSIVIDEIIAVPVCFLGWVFHLALQLGELPSLDFFFGPTTWFLAVGVFLAFRFFDIVKPWPVKQSQDVPRGWGVVLDDLLAAVYVNLVILLIHLGLQFFSAPPSA